MARTENAKNTPRDTYARIGEKLNAAVEDTPLFSAYLYEHKVQCGRPTCKCANTSFRHPMWCVSFTENGRSRTRVVPIEQLSEVRDMTDAYRRFRQARSEIQKLCGELMAALDAFGERHCQEGKARYDRLRTAQTRKRARKSSTSRKSTPE